MQTRVHEHAHAHALACTCMLAGRQAGRQADVCIPHPPAPGCKPCKRHSKKLNPVRARPPSPSPPPSEFPGQLQKILEWFRDYKMPDGKVSTADSYVQQTELPRTDRAC